MMFRARAVGELTKHLPTNGILLMAAVSLLSACESTGMDSASKYSTSDSVELPPTEALPLEPLLGVPAFSLGPKDAPDELAVFVSPSCNFCEVMLLDVLGAVARRDPLLRDIRITFAMIPRKDADVRIINGFMCVPDDQRPMAIVDYFRNVNAAIGRSPIHQDTANAQYRRTLGAYGASPEMRLRCEESEFLKTVTTAVYNLGDSFRTRDKVPIVVHNNHYVDVLNFRDLREYLKKEGV